MIKARNKSTLPLVLLICLHLVILTKLTFTAWPEMFSFPYLVNNTFRLYSDFVHPYPPFLTLVLSFLFKTMGYSTLVLRIFTYLLVVCADYLIYKIVLKSSNQVITATLCLLFYIFAQSFLEGNMLWFDTALVVPLLLSFMSHKENSDKKFGVAVLTATLIKQTALLYVAVYGVVLLLERKVSRLQKLCVALALGWGTLFVFLVAQKSLQEFLLWNFIYPFTQWSSFPGYVNFSLTKRDVLLVILISFPVIISAIKKQYLVVLLYIVGLISIYPRFSFFHMQPAIAISAVSLGVVSLRKVEQYLVFTFVILFTIVLLRVPVTTGGVRFFEESTYKLSEKLSNEIKPDSRVLFVNIPSQYYQLTHHLPPKPWFDTYGWYYEMPGESDRVIHAYQVSPPEYIVRQLPQPGNWYDLGTYEPQAITNFLEKDYIEQSTIDQNITIWKRK